MKDFLRFSVNICFQIKFISVFYEIVYLNNVVQKLNLTEFFAFGQCTLILQIHTSILQSKQRLH